jgi:hypothetical protein
MRRAEAPWLVLWWLLLLCCPQVSASTYKFSGLQGVLKRLAHPFKFNSCNPGGVRNSMECPGPGRAVCWLLCTDWTVQNQV